MELGVLPCPGPCSRHTELFQASRVNICIPENQKQKNEASTSWGAEEEFLTLSIPAHKTQSLPELGSFGRGVSLALPAGAFQPPAELGWIPAGAAAAPALLPTGAAPAPAPPGHPPAPPTPDPTEKGIFPICSLCRTRGGSGCHSQPCSIPQGQEHPPASQGSSSPRGEAEGSESTGNAELGKPHPTPGQASHGSSLGRFCHHSPTFGPSRGVSISTTRPRQPGMSFPNNLPAFPRDRVLSGDGSPAQGWRCHMTQQHPKGP